MFLCIEIFMDIGGPNLVFFFNLVHACVVVLCPTFFFLCIFFLGFVFEISFPIGYNCPSKAYK